MGCQDAYRPLPNRTHQLAVGISYVNAESIGLTGHTAAQPWRKGCLWVFSSGIRLRWITVKLRGQQAPALEDGEAILFAQCAQVMASAPQSHRPAH